MKQLTLLFLLITVQVEGQNKRKYDQESYQFVNGYLQQEEGVVLERETYPCFVCHSYEAEKEVDRVLKMHSFTNQDIRYVKKQLKDNQRFEWNADSLVNIKVYSHSRLEELLPDQKDQNSWRQFQKQHGNVLYRINKPVLTKDKQYLLVNIFRNCGSKCAHMALFVFKKENGIWREFDQLFSLRYHE